jgi:hypothetical protein
MRRIGAAIGLAVLLVLIVVLSWNLNRAHDKLNAARSDRGRTHAEVSSVPARLERAVERASIAIERSEVQLKKARDNRRALRKSQQCSPAYAGHLWLFPKEGPVGTRVRFVGDCFVHESTDSSRDFRSAFGITLIRQIGNRHPSGECEQIVGAGPFRIRIKNGRAKGFFTVQSEGSCFQQGGGPYPVVLGKYTVAIGCHACTTNARFRVTGA